MALDIHNDPAFERRMDLARRIAWALMVLAVVAALLGVFGNGLLAESSARGGGNPAMTVRYDRFARYLSPTEIVVEVEPPAQEASELQLVINRGYVADIRLHQVTPEPDSVTLENDAYVMEFQVDAWEETLSIHIEFEPDHWGRLSGRMQARAGGSEGEWVSFRQFVFP